MLAEESCKVNTALVVVPALSSTTVASLIVIAGTATMTLPLAALLANACSGSLAEIVALLTSAPGCVVCKVTLIEAEPPLTKVPSEHTTPPPVFEQLPCDDVADTNVALAGIGLVIVTPVAVAGPRLVARIVNVTLLPTTTGFGAPEIPASAASIEFRSTQQAGSG